MSARKKLKNTPVDKQHHEFQKLKQEIERKRKKREREMENLFLQQYLEDNDLNH